MSKDISKRQMMREKRAREASRGRLVSIGLVVVGVILVFGLILGPTISGILNPYTPTAPPARTLPDGNDNTLGSPDAPITITEFSDFQCPYCRRFTEETEDQLFQSYVATGQVYFVYRSFGAFIGPESGASAEAAYCAGEQGKFWEMHAIIFANQTGENVGAYSDRHLTTFAQAIGLDMNAFNSCTSSNKFTDRITQDGIDGVSAGIQATPSFILTYVVNGETKTKMIKGAESFTTFQTEIEAALAEIAAAQ